MELGNSSEDIELMIRLMSSAANHSQSWVVADGDIFGDIGGAGSSMASAANHVLPINYTSDLPPGFDFAEQHGELYELTIGEKVLWFFVYGVIAFLAVFGNLLVIYVVFTCPRLQNTTNFFIVNLALADAMTGLLAIPFKFQAALLQTWYLPNIMCSVVPFIETVSLSVSVFTLTATAVDRFRAVIWPTEAKMTKSCAKLIIMCVWAFSVAFSIPYGVDHQVEAFPQNVTIGGGGSLLTDDGNSSGPGEDEVTVIYILQCLPAHGEELWWKAYNIYLTIIQYFVPLFIIDGAYIIIGYKVWLTKPMIDVRDERSRMFEQNKKRVVKMLIIVVAVFTFCWLPYETYLVLNEVRPNINEYRYINIIFFCSHWLAMSNSCLNPIIYGIYNEKFQREYRRVFASCCGAVPDNKRDASRTMMTAALDSQETVFLRSDGTCDGALLNSCHYYIASELGKDDD